MLRVMTFIAIRNNVDTMFDLCGILFFLTNKLDCVSPIFTWNVLLLKNVSIKF